MAETTSPRVRLLLEALASGAVTRERMRVAAYLGYPPARELLGSESPTVFSLESMRRGGDRCWREAMRAMGHEPVAAAACAIAELALAAYLDKPDSASEVAALAGEAVAALRNWSGDPQSDTLRADVREKAGNFCLAVDVGGRLAEVTGFRGRQLGSVLGKCYSTVLAPDNPRLVRWFGEAAEITCRTLGVPEPSVGRAVSAVLLPFVLPAGC